MPNYYQPEMETMPQEEIRALQNERLVKQVRHVWDNVPYYRKKMEEKGVTPDDINHIPICFDNCVLPWSSLQRGII